MRSFSDSLYLFIGTGEVDAKEGWKQADYPSMGERKMRIINAAMLDMCRPMDPGGSLKIEVRADGGEKGMCFLL